MRPATEDLRVGIDTLFTSTSPRGSLVDYLRGVVRYTLRALPNLQLTLFVSHENRVLYEDLANSQVLLTHVGASNERPLARILTQQFLLPRAIARSQVQVLFAGADVAPLSCPCPVVLKVNTLHHYHEPWALGRARSFYRRLMIRASAARAEWVVANSAATRSDILRFLPVRPERVILSYEAVDEAFVPASAVAVGEARRRLGLPTRYLLFVSRLYPYKNLDTLVHAFALVSGAGTFDGWLVVAGDDYQGERGRLEALCERLGCRHRVLFLGSIPNQELPPVLCGAEALVYPSLQETFGKPLVEAMRCGVPVVAAHAGAIPEIVRDAALLFAPRDIEGLASALVRVTSDKDLRHRLVTAGQARATFFSWSRAARELVEVWRQASKGASSLSSLESALGINEHPTPNAMYPRGDGE